MAVWRTFLKFEAPQSHYCQQQAVTLDPGISNFKKVCPTAITICRGLSQQTQEVQILKKVRQTAITICRGLSQPTQEVQI
jgi:hypothetical protein